MQALQTYQDRYQSLFEQVRDAIYISTLDGQLVDINPAGIEMFGYDRSELMDLDIRQLYADPEEREHFRQIIFDLGGIKEYPVRLRRKDGVILNCLLTSSLWDDGQGVVLGYQGIIRDVTARWQAEMKLQEYAKELEERNAELDSFSHTIAHDLKGSLQNIVLGLDLITEEEHGLSETQHSLLDIALDASHKANRMIEGLLLFARLRDASEVISEVDMEAAAQAALARLQHHIQARQMTIEVESPLLPALGYAPWVEEVLANLVGNAVKYCGHDNPNPTICIRSYPAGDRVCYEVEDNGLGIPPENLSTLFAMFSRFHTAEAEGTGLGLSIVQRIVTKLNGEVGVRSEVGRGSTFWFALPAA